jgi:hypothetical protein
MNIQPALLHPAEILPSGELLLGLERFKVPPTHLDGDLSLALVLVKLLNEEVGF